MKPAAWPSPPPIQWPSGARTSGNRTGSHPTSMMTLRTSQHLTTLCTRESNSNRYTNSRQMTHQPALLSRNTHSMDWVQFVATSQWTMVVISGQRLWRCCWLYWHHDWYTWCRSFSRTDRGLMCIRCSHRVCHTRSNYWRYGWFVTSKYMFTCSEGRSRFHSRLEW